MSLTVSAGARAITDTGRVATDPTVGITFFLASEDGHGGAQFSVSLSIAEARALAAKLLAAADEAPTLPSSTWSGSVAEMIAQGRIDRAGGSSEPGGER